jgi:hypothetical protein
MAVTKACLQVVMAAKGWGSVIYLIGGWKDIVLSFLALGKTA